MYWETNRQSYLAINKSDGYCDILSDDIKEFSERVKKDFYDNEDEEFFILFHSDRDVFDLSFWELTVEMDWHDGDIDLFEGNFLKLDRRYLLTSNF